MVRLTRFVLPALILIHWSWRLFSDDQSMARDLILYNLVWLIALITLFYAPLDFDRVALAAISLALLCWGAGSLASSIDEFLVEAPAFTIATQIGYALFYPLILLAIPRLAATTSKLKPIEVLDALIFGLGLTSIISTVLSVMIFPADALTGSENFFLIFYPVGDIALLLISITMLITRGADRKSLLFATGILIFALTDFYYLWLAINQRYSFGGAADDLRLVAIAIIVIAITFSGSKVITPSPIHPALVALSIFISPILLAITALRPDAFPIYIVLPAIANLISPLFG